MQTLKKALVIGFPVAHARSPLIHGYWLKELGLPGAYERAEVKPGTVGAFLRALPAQGYAGGNITVPHKEEAFAACDNLTERARMAGAVNTIWFENGALTGDNTDGLGFVSHLNQTFPGALEGARVLLLGAGGAARGLIVPLLDQGVKNITITNRSPERAEALVADLHTLLPEARLEVVAWEAREAALSAADILVNTTSLGMKGQPALAVDLSTMPAHAIVADIVYVPLETELLHQAAARGLRTLDGLGMLLHQAVPGFEHWFGVTPAVTPALRAHLVADLEKKG
jgi:shikimate dehydrogenase